MGAKYILAVLGAVFLVLAIVRISKDGRLAPASRTWLIIGGVFCLVSFWLWFR